MKTKHKRLIIIGCCIAWGMFTLSVAAWDCNFLNYENGNPTIFGYICFYSIVVARWICGLLCSVIKINAIDHFLFFVIQFLAYNFIGIIVARAAYPPWRKTKPLPESDKPSEFD